MPTNAELAQKIARLESELALTLGRLNGVQALILHALRFPNATPEASLNALLAATDRLKTDLRATQLPEASIIETIRTLELGTETLAAVVKESIRQ